MDVTFLTTIRRLGKLYEKVMRPVRDKYSMSQFEIDVLGFLHNNSDMDTASEIVKYRMIPKANVSQAVDSLIKKDMLISVRDEKDRRKVHLKIKNAANEVIAEILKAQSEFTEIIFENFTEDEKLIFKNFSRNISKNILTHIKKDD